MSNIRKPNIPWLRGNVPGFVITRVPEAKRKINRRRLQGYRRQAYCNETFNKEISSLSSDFNQSD